MLTMMSGNRLFQRYPATNLTVTKHMTVEVFTEWTVIPSSSEMISEHLGIVSVTKGQDNIRAALLNPQNFTKAK